MAKILLVEDDLEIASGLEQWLSREKYVVEVVHDGSEAQHRLQSYTYDAVILDWQLPGVNGVDLCKGFRQRGGTTPILMLTGMTTFGNKETGFDAGADDYLTKPFDIREVGLRLRAILRRGSDVTDNLITAGPITLDTKLRKLKVNGADVTLLPKEFAILELLMKHPGEIFSAEALLNRVWSSESESTDHTVRTYMHTLRKKLLAKECDVVKTVHGIGYRLEV